MQLRKVISGGQTGADRAALDACLDAGFETGGFCPAGREAEDGPIDERYPLTEISGGYRQRTKRNVEAADATLIFYQAELHGGTAMTLEFCLQAGKPYKLVDIDLAEPQAAIAAIGRFVADHEITVLNVAGPRASGCPPMYVYVRNVVKGVIADSGTEDA